MKSTLNSLRVTAAGLALSAAAAYGQSNIVANVPFAFHTVAGTQPAGQYSIGSASHDGAVLRLYNVETSKNSLLGLGTPDGIANQDKPKLVFRCGDETGCVLSGVWMGDGRGWSYKTHMKPRERERIAVVYFQSKQAE